ncbi:hypothetical protein KFL_003250160 [Klebsormidium nitens]|uniref:Uncharacterized protein n=1 Tax=Klebsormidium nitens TaxID=105231 RepID=A0A1Y1I8Z1_KLENI|nr:hypothetical protein KFL_003250160 [Klebsormidium nitens]|eukprot:GAQ87013.1 hypothetical protein KFL_003250160 [Klebsormidium nitens]
MISGDQTKDLWAILVVVFLLPVVMLSMRMTGGGKKKGQKASRSRFVSQVAASFFATILLGFFGMFGLALMYASSSQVDYAAAGAGWWRETLRVFCQEEGLHFGQGHVSDLTCDHDVFQLERIDENTLAYLPRPFIASMIIRDPRGIVLEEYEKLTSQCMIKGKMLKAATSIEHIQGDSTQQERRRLREIDLSMKLNYEDLWGNAAAGFAEAGRWYGLKHFSRANIDTFKREFGHSLVELGYEGSLDSW